MRLVSMELHGFRGFPTAQRFDLDADAVIVVGANGQGKTSLLDGVLWALSGWVPRLGDDQSQVISMYADEGQARAELHLVGEDGASFAIARSYDGSHRRVSLEAEGQTLHGPSAEGKLLELIWPDAASARDPDQALASVLTRSVYLQQDLVRQFIEADSDQERFAAVSELVGAGRVTELQASLERAKRAWSTATNQRQEELLPLRERLARIDARLAQLSGVKSVAVSNLSFQEWQRRVRAIGVELDEVDVASGNAPVAMDVAMKQLAALRSSKERRLQALMRVESELLATRQESVPAVQPLQEEVAKLRKELLDLNRRAVQEQGKVAELRRKQAESEGREEQLKALATIALQNLGERCPVCDQAYDREATQRRLKRLVKSAGIARQATDESSVGTVLAAIAEKEKQVAASEMALRAAEIAATNEKSSRATISRYLEELGFDASDSLDRTLRVREASAEAASLIREMSDLTRLGEVLSLSLMHASTAERIDELTRETRGLKEEIGTREKDVGDRLRTGDEAQRVIEALREAASTVVEKKILEIAPILQSIYSSIDPHPSLRVVTFLSTVARGKGRLSTVVSDPAEGKQSNRPTAVLSSSQINALAVSVFLALNMGTPKPPLSTIMLDDPLQSLDDINLLGLVDLLRHTKDKRQLCVSTHDARFGELLARKLRPRADQGTTLVIELSGWGRRGPVVETRSVRPDPVPLRLLRSLAAG